MKVDLKTGFVLPSDLQTNGAESKKISKLDKFKDSFEFSSTPKVFDKLNNFLNLGKSDRLDTSDLNPAEKEEFLQMLSKLLQAGVVGYEMLEIDGKVEKHYIVNQIGNPRTKGAKVKDDRE